MRVLYLGDQDAGSTSRHRADALRRMGCQVEHLDPHDALGQSLHGWRGAFHYRTGYLLTHRAVLSWLDRTLDASQRYDLCWVDSGELISASALRRIKLQCAQVVLFNHDDPTGTRDWLRFITLRAAVPQYDLCLAVRDFNLPEFKALGARDVMHVWRGFDEVAHRPIDPLSAVNPVYRNEIVFIGRCMDGEGRDLLMQALIKRGLKPAIWGDNWQRSPVWADLKPYWRGGSLSGQDYVDAMRGAQICIGMLSKGNRDLHTTRTMEIPAAGGLLCAERTTEHQQLYREGEEAVFWSSHDECARQCEALLADPALTQRIRAAGQARLLLNRVGNEDICKAVFQRLKLS
ncbi:MAG: glycosyltransferase [Aquabacterium sp.]|nr:glycosyltransferase [Aquabacterium sp.]